MKSLEYIPAATQCHTVAYLHFSSNNNILEVPGFTCRKVFASTNGPYSEGRPKKYKYLSCHNNTFIFKYSETYSALVPEEWIDVHLKLMLLNSHLRLFGFILLLLHIRDLHLYFDANQDSHDSKDNFRRQLKYPGWQWVFQLIFFPSDSKEKTSEETADFSFSSISFERFRFLGTLMLQFCFFYSRTAIERNRKLSIPGFFTKVQTAEPN